MPAHTLEGVRRGLEARLGVDVRALAAVRILLGLCIVLDVLVFRLPEVRTFYSDAGVVPVATLAEVFPAFATLSLHALSGSVWVQAALMAVLAASGVAVAVGYRTRVAMLVAAVLLASMQARNPLVLSGGDTILVVLLVFGLFLPLDARWSLRPRPVEGAYHYSAATATTLAFVVMVYATNGLLKLDSEAWLAGEAVAQLSHADGYWNPLGHQLAEVPLVLEAVNWVWMALLLASPLLVALRGRGRLAIAGALLVAQAGMVATLWIGVFPLVLLSALVLFVPSMAWDRLEALADGRSRPRWLSPTPTDDVAPASLRDRPSRRRQVVSVALVLLLVGLTGYQVTATGLAPGPDPTGDVEVVGASWAMFASPPAAHTWYVLDVEVDGDRIDALTGGEPVLDRQPDTGEAYDSWLWKRYGMHLRSGDDRLYDPLAAYACDAVDDAAAVEVHRLDMPIDADGPTGDLAVTTVFETDC